MKLNKKQLDSYSRKFCNIIKNKKCKIYLQKLRKKQGYYYIDGKDIVIDYRFDILTTTIHEMLHYMYEEKSETEIESLTKNLINQFSIKQIKRILKELIKIL